LVFPYFTPPLSCTGWNISFGSDMSLNAKIYGPLNVLFNFVEYLPETLTIIGCFRIYEYISQLPLTIKIFKYTYINIRTTRSPAVVSTLLRILQTTFLILAWRPVICRFYFVFQSFSWLIFQI
jgi:hypothetical protein